jgi:hypothetical protein
VTPRSQASLAIALLLVSIIAITGCGSSNPSPSSTPTPSSPSSVAPSEVPETLPPATLGPLLEGQTDTDWGRLWDTLPTGFPLYPGATRSDEAQEGPSSGVYVVEGDPETIATWFQDQLEIAAFSTESLSGPLEDGSYELDSIGQDVACRVRVTIAPLGGLTALTVFYGAGCPHD